MWRKTEDNCQMSKGIEKCTAEKDIWMKPMKYWGYLGSGSGGVIYKAYHKRLQKEVVLKKIKRKSRDARINRNEVDILKNLNHMYLPQVVDF